MQLQMHEGVSKWQKCDTSLSHLSWERWLRAAGLSPKVNRGVGPSFPCTMVWGVPLSEVRLHASGHCSAVEHLFILGLFSDCLLLIQSMARFSPMDWPGL